MVLALALVLLAVTTATAEPARAASEPEYQLSLGDSLTVGMGSSTPTVDYVNVLASHMADQVPGLSVENLACPGETTSQVVNGSFWCPYPGGTQLAAAEAFLRAHPGQVRYITIDIGINDVDQCLNQLGVDQSCVNQGLTAVAQNLPLIAAGLKAAGPGVAIFGADSFDPYLAGYGFPDPYMDQGSLAPGFASNSFQMMTSLNATLDWVYQVNGVRIVDVAGAFDTDDRALTGYVNGHVEPQNVSDICELTHMCDTSGWTIHLNDAGYAVVAQTFEAAVGSYLASRGKDTWLVDSAGVVHPLDSTASFGDLSGHTLNRPIVDIAGTPDGSGYWLVASDGGIFSYGDAAFYGSTGGMSLNKPIVGIASTPDGLGYWLVASDGGIFAFGEAAFYGSTGGMSLNKPIVGMASTPDSLGYWLVASDGGIFAFGDAAFYGSTGGAVLNRPIVSVAATPDGLGYWLVASDGGVFAFGDAAFYGSTGSIRLNRPVVAIVGAPLGDGYTLIASDGGTFAFGSTAFEGSLGASPPGSDVVGATSR